MTESKEGIVRMHEPLNPANTEVIYSALQQGMCQCGFAIMDHAEDYEGYKAQPGGVGESPCKLTPEQVLKWWGPPRAQMNWKAVSQ